MGEFSGELKGYQATHTVTVENIGNVKLRLNAISNGIYQCIHSAEWLLPDAPRAARQVDEAKIDFSRKPALPCPVDVRTSSRVGQAEHAESRLDGR